MTIAGADPLVHRWNALEADRPMDLITRRRIIGQQMMLSHVTLEKGFKLDTHRHENEQMAVVLSGMIRFGLGEPGGADFREVTLEAGEVLHLPSKFPHSAEAIETTVVLDAFSPPSETTGVDQK